MARSSILTACLALTFASSAGAQDLMLFDPGSFGETVLPRQESLLGDVRLEAQVGAYNNEFVSSYGPQSIFARTGRAVGRLDVLTNVGHAPCTAFLVEGNLLVTNHHCVPGILDNPQMKAQGAERILAVQFKAGYLRDGIEEGVRSYTVDPEPLETNAALDYTVLQVFGDPNAEFGALDLSALVPSDRDPFWVIGHPMGEAQRISREKCQADSPAIASGKLRHTCDTLPGNSGSPVIDAGLQQVVALHHAGSRAGAVNFAIPMADILSASSVLSAAGGSSDIDDAARRKLDEELAALRAERDRLQADLDARAKTGGDETGATPPDPTDGPDGLDGFQLIGVYGTDSDPRALVRRPDGRFVKVETGDDLNGGIVFAIARDSLSYQRDGVEIVLRLPGDTAPPAAPEPEPERYGLAPGDMGLAIEVAGPGAQGTIVIDLLEDIAPGHAERLAHLARTGAYDGVVFHRVIDGFMAQTGDVQFGVNSSGGPVDLSRAGTGGSDLPDLKAEFSDVAFERGVVGMARAGHPDSANSQFFIMFADGPFLNGQYTVVGRVIEGMDVVDTIKRGDRNGNGAVRGEADRMMRVTVID